MSNESGTKIVFLDCDGVVSPFSDGSLFSKVHMARLKRILTSTGAKLVLSSSWRTTDFGRKEVTSQLVQNGMPTFIGCTPELSGQSRACEILAWLKANKETYHICNFVALDDINLAASAPDRAFFARHAVVTNSFTGLTESDTDKAIALLDNSNNLPQS
ncbi:hypothetical protein STCU_00975 [Strigomonas culicis]|uniref:Uncharacterized protein n=1 Tax=Strigomonas culicis TaxID=28005 RepID=S9WB16_9TRYP|nr:hypothetical protein STCU_06872 [Strigomonas culicis]EPY33160.1 hypothetical protein STCU_02458 [Strigomonas culicis]EPY35699.1 hypothetical protein STCU_00975 [Strigomonas culicis]|eukprot:EPY25042.1 hypothetical protein STCU_06872 [Strigomonas culicis]